MRRLKGLFQRLRKPVNYSASDPENFSEIWSFTSNRLRIFSLVIAVFLALLFTGLYFFSPLFVSYQGSKGIKRELLEDQAKEIKNLQDELDTQEKYINSMRLILLGEVPLDVDLDSLSTTSTSQIERLYSQNDTIAAQLAEKVREDMRTTTKSDKTALFYAPVKGVVSQDFGGLEHPGIDVVTEKNANIVACLAGTIVYSGFSRKDGYVMIVHHSGGFLSVYKHCKTIFKKTGDRVQIGDPIGIVGDSGENSKGPHLHFELWNDRHPVDPKRFISFKK
jgi:murein DD-endopeptidase MepM/ murein hydrolase activator NlpD